MKIIADGGGTKTDWKVFPTDSADSVIVTTEGINPSVMPFKALEERVGNFFETLKTRYPEIAGQRNDLRFYGAGCATTQAQDLLRNIIRKSSGVDFNSLYIGSDLEGSALALFGSESGIACILGTGSATGYYDGICIVDSVPAMGYLLGDEGSGAFMGKMLVNRYFKRGLSHQVNTLLEDFHDMSIEEVLLKSYRDGHPGSYLGSFVPFLKENENLEEINDIINLCLKLFFENNVLKYKNIPHNTKIGFVGGVACAFRDRLSQLSEQYGFIPTRFLKRPIEGL